jgi:sulfatase modifying factor 1
MERRYGNQPEQFGEAGRVPEGYAYTLPGEAQWEYACRAGTTGPYAGSGMLDDMAWYRANSDGAPREVGRKRPNAWGFFDMHGNVWEWCLGPFQPFLPGGTIEDWTGPTRGIGRPRRGGGWQDGAGDCRAACRVSEPPTYTRKDFGFRLALVPQP